MRPSVPLHMDVAVVLATRVAREVVTKLSESSTTVIAMISSLIEGCVVQLAHISRPNSCEHLTAGGSRVEGEGVYIARKDF
jgi:hypothetical protein